MKNKQIGNTARVILFFTGLLLIAVLFVPIWRIELNAPQYPEGLSMSIYANRIGGNVDIINGLNHYIGMRTIHDKDFPIEAEIEDIKAFYILLKSNEGEIVTFPNNLLMQKGISIVNEPIERNEFTD